MRELVDFMSERTLRKQNAEILAQRIARVEKEQGAAAKEKEALELAHRVLLEEPKAKLPCNMVLEFARFHALTQRAYCSECRGTGLIGWTEEWQWCPRCGSQIVNTDQELNPNDRNVKERVDSALREIKLHA